MSRPRSRSPHYRRFPWEEPDFDPHKVLAVLDGNPSGRSHRLRQDPEENWDYFREDSYPEGQRRSSPFSDERPFERRCHPDEDEFYRRRPSPRYEPMGFDNRRHSPPRNVGGDGERHRAGFREHFHGFENKGRSSHTPPGLVRERLPPMSRSHTDQPGTGWREEQDRGRGRFREVSPSDRTDEQRGGAGRERGRRNEHEHNRRRDVPHQERNPLSKRQRREMDDSSHLGYRNEEDFGEQRYSKDSPRGGFGGNFHGDARRLRPLIIEHDHGISEGRKPPHWEKFNDHRDPGVDFNRQRSPRPGGSSSQDRFRTEEREDARGRNFQDKWRESNFIETRRSPVQPDRPNLMRFGNRDGSVNLRGRGGGVRSARGRLKRGRTGPLRNETRLQQTSLGFKDPPHEEQQPSYRPFREDRYEDPVEGETSWSGEERLQQWERERPRSLEQHPARVDLDPKMPRQRERGWIDQKSSNTSAAKDETLTIKVDMKRPVNHNSSLCYSSDRQLSLDLVNVGRQRLDFLPMLEHSGTYRETAVHTGTFAQEIITLVHHVKEQYFRDDGITLNERFSAPQKGGFTEEETEELTLDERFSSNRGFTLNMNSLLEEEEEEPLFSRLGPKQSLNQQPVRGPGDLRHDLERRRQERLEGVKVTIPGNTASQLPHGSVSESGFDYDDDKDEMVQMDDVEFTTWSDEPSRRREGINSAPRRGAAFRLNSGVQRRNHRFGERGGPMRRQNNRSNAAGLNW